MDLPLVIKAISLRFQRPHGRFYPRLLIWTTTELQSPEDRRTAIQRVFIGLGPELASMVSGTGQHHAH
jgi:hypothetical protein